MRYNKRYKRLNEDTIADLAGNKCLDEILDMYEIIKMSVRLYFSRLLYYTDYDKPLEISINLNNTYLKSAQKKKLTITKILQDPIEGFIILQGSRPNEHYDLNDFNIEEQIYILKYILEF